MILIIFGEHIITIVAWNLIMMVVTVDQKNMTQEPVKE